MAKRYTEAQKSSLLSKYHSLRNSGKTAQQAAKAIKVSYLTLRRWEREGGSPAARKAGRGKGTVADVVRSGSITLTMPGGYRIETDSPEQMAEILNMLRK